MREQLITSEPAKLAKEKGFDMYCEWSYWEGSLTHGVPGHPLEDGKHSDYDRYLLFPRHLAPTQSLLQKWLREVHNIDVWSQPFVMNKSLPDESYSYFIYVNGIFVKDGMDYIDFEEALEKGLQEALKLI